MKKTYLLWSIIIWSLILIVSFTWNYYLVESSNSKLVLNKSRAFFEQILVTRAWGAEHGGVYVPITPKTQPNQYLEDSLRDVVTTDGQRLTKINPAYMTRQIAEINELKNDLQFHITSLNPIRPANMADAWEAKSLKMFEKGVSENIELITDDSISQYRYMAPLITGNSCLKCHSEQGYKNGDIRGGISISFPAKEITDSVNKQLSFLGFIHLIILILGVLGLWVYYRKTNKYLLIIENKNNELTQTNAEKDKFFSIIAHDLKSPFNSILGFSDLLVEQVQTNDYDGIEEYTNVIHDSSQRAIDLLMNLMDWSRSQTGRMEFTPEYLKIAELCKETVGLLRPTAGQKSITIKNEVPQKAIAFADKAMISTVFRNLISNAIKFTKPGGKIVVSAHEKPNELMISVSDSGVGIPKDKIEKLFILSESYSTTGTNKEKGTGLGLILCKEFVEKNSGKIWVESDPDSKSGGTGSTFYFTIPKKPL